MIDNFDSFLPTGSYEKARSEDRCIQYTEVLITFPSKFIYREGEYFSI